MAMAVAMGSRPARVLANLFMSHHEKKLLEKYNGPEVIFYSRHVDDTFCLSISDTDAAQFFDYINSQHVKIKFTMEKEENQQLPFLDVLIYNSLPDFLVRVTSVFRKKTYTGLLILIFSVSKSLIRTLVDRAFKIDNTWSGFHIDIQ